MVLEFIGPFCRLLEEHGARLHADSFRLTGNVRSLATGAALSGQSLEAMTEQLYREQTTRQPLVAGVAQVLDRLDKLADIVFLTAMTPDHYPLRRQHLDEQGLSYPMIATKRPKGAVVAELRRRWSGPIVFVDDLPPNLAGVRRSAPDVRLLHLMAHEAFRPHLPPLPLDAVGARDWAEAEATIRGWIVD